LAVVYPPFANDPSVSLNAIAKFAGVDANVLLNHLPAREDIIVDVYQQEVQLLSFPEVRDSLAEGGWMQESKASIEPRPL
jgi:hypothetical protein